MLGKSLKNISLHIKTFLCQIAQKPVTALNCLLMKMLLQMSLVVRKYLISLTRLENNRSMIIFGDKPR